MRKHWLLSAATVLALFAMPARAEETAKPPAAPEKAAAAPAAPAAPVLMAQGTPAPAAAAPAETPPPAPNFTYGGSADFYYYTNFNEPVTNTNLFRAFDLKHEAGINLGLLHLWAQ